ncbi:MAG TPA: metallophosphoesterase [Devosiaceae bacterium]|jgi:3',5'-cyclic AMP phosphodiesterase CpdA|nr:metallophosphoesterase [Devosiaceae bacterium]
MITLAHLSDIHLAPLPRIRVRDLLNKRLTGYLNWRLERHNSLDGVGLAALIAHLHEQHADFTAVTGDLVNLALEEEIAVAAGWLKGIGPPEKVCVSPGNHDAYLPGTLTQACGYWDDYVSGEAIDAHVFPFVRRIGEVAVISCCSAVPTPPFFSSGRFDPDQAARLARILDLLGEADYFRIVLIHHPPDASAEKRRSGLRGARLFREVIAETGAEMVLHGHTHRATINAIPGPRSEVPVIGVAAAGTAQHAKPDDDPARYNLFRIERTETGWTCNMAAFGFRPTDGEIGLLMQARIY